MHERCADLNNPYYGGKGLKVCYGWRWSQRGIENFVRDMGPPPKEKPSIDRIDNSIGYACGKCKECKRERWPANCRWADWVDQANNRGNTRMLTWKGKTHTLSQWSKKTGIPSNVISDRLDVGSWSVEDALTHEVQLCIWKTHVVELRGESKTYQEWADDAGLPFDELKKRLHAGWTLKKALKVPAGAETKTAPQETYSYKGETGTLEWWAARSRIPVGILHYRLVTHGWTMHKALTTRVQRKTK